MALPCLLMSGSGRIDSERTYMRLSLACSVAVRTILANARTRIPGSVRGPGFPEIRPEIPPSSKI